MNQEDYPLSDLDSLLSKDSITEDDLLHPQELFPEEPKTPSNQTSITDELENLPITSTDKLTIALNVRPRKQKPTTPQNNYFENRGKAKKLRLIIISTKKPQFQFNLTYKIEENIN